MATPRDGLGGYEYQFVDPPLDDLICKICHFPSREAYLSECCGNTFCRSCLEGVKKVTGRGRRSANACPICRKEKFVTFSNKQADRAIRSLYVFCNNKAEGCEWKGEINCVSKHLDHCHFQEVHCPYRCGQRLLRHSLTSHATSECLQRYVNCHYCNTKGKYYFIRGKHIEQCVEAPVPCPNSCEVHNILRKDVNKHLNECPLQVIQCEYCEVGCEKKFCQKDQKRHNEEMMEMHLLFTKTKLACLELKVTEIELASQKKIANLEHEFQQKLELFIGKETMEHLANITETASKQLSGDQVLPVTVKMSGYDNKRSKFIKWHSHPFYTHHMGYKMYLTVDVAGPYLSLAIYLMAGPYDDHLNWPLEKECVVKLLNQVSNNNHHYGPTQSLASSFVRIFKSITRVTDQDKLVWQSPKFISIEDLNKVTGSHQYLKHDSIFLQVAKLQTN